MCRLAEVGEAGGGVDVMMGACVCMQALVGASGEGEQVREDGSRKSATVGYAFGSAQAVARSSSPGSRPGGGCGDGSGSRQSVVDRGRGGGWSSVLGFKELGRLGGEGEGTAQSAPSFCFLSFICCEFFDFGLIYVLIVIYGLWHRIFFWEVVFLL